MTGLLEGTVALVTGASSGIGEATAEALAAEGASVAVVARRRDRLEALAGRIGNDTKTLVVEADITHEGSACEAVERTVGEYGRLDVLVNNAGVMLLGPVLDAPVDEWRRMIDLNLLGLLHCTHAALPYLLKAAESDPRRVADLVNVSSVAGRVALKGSGVYNATKFGVGAFSESLRKEVTARHVRVSLVEPGGVLTELYDHNRPEIIGGMVKRMSEVQMLRAEDVAAAVVFAVTRPRHVAINELLVRATQQEI
jgi:NADP-dependent 3-hydroxy acid dehydrogenase YdfG